VAGEPPAAGEAAGEEAEAETRYGRITE
jgi:hypothetical protein